MTQNRKRQRFWLGGYFSSLEMENLDGESASETSGRDIVLRIRLCSFIENRMNFNDGPFSTVL